MMDENQNPNTNPQENTADRISKELQVNLPGKDLPTMLRLITFFTLIGGLSIIGGLFADIVRPTTETPFFYLLRTIIGLAAVSIAYGIIEKRRWAIWLYGIIALIALFTNPFLALIPGFVVAYLYIHRALFIPSIFDYLLWQLILQVKAFFRRNNTNGF